MTVMNHESYDPGYLRGLLRAARVIALVGASANPLRPSYFVMKYLIEKGYRVIPVNPGLAGKTILGQTVRSSLAEIQELVDMVDIFRNAEAAGEVVDEALALDPLPRLIWMQLGVRNDEAARRAEAKGVAVVMDRCPKMEYGKLSGEWAWVGGNPTVISSRRQSLHASGRLQSLGLGEER